MRDRDNQFGEYVHLHNFPRAAEALDILRKIGSCVKPIMRKRGWRVGQLCEFFPNEKNLLGLNTDRGRMIHLRLRYPGDVNQFMPFEQILDTMLHELSHNEIGPHDERFHALWDSLREEWYQLQLKGYTGEGFLGKGRKLGGMRIPDHEMRRRAHASALQREKERQKSGGRRLGGLLPSRGTNPVAEAAIRRSTEATDKGCGTGTRAGQRAAEDAARNGFKTKAEMDEANEIAIQQALFDLMEQEELMSIQTAVNRSRESESETYPTDGLIWDPEHGLQAAPVPKPASKPAASPAFGTQPRPIDLTSNGRPISRLVHEAEASRKPVKRASTTPSSRPSTANKNRLSASSSTANWSCDRCTLINAPSSTRCEVCENPREPLVAATAGPPSTWMPVEQVQREHPEKPLGWGCRRCGNWMEWEWWTCSVCGLVKANS